MIAQGSTARPAYFDTPNVSRWRKAHSGRSGIAPLCAEEPLAASRRALLLAGSALLTAPKPPPALAIGAAVAPLVSSIPTAELAPGLDVSQVIKGCWQLSGGHHGEKQSDRTSGKEAVQDFAAFVNAGVTSFDTADIYGPSESLIGQFVKARPGGREGLQILTKQCYFGNEMYNVSRDSVRGSLQASLRRLQVPQVDSIQLYWHQYGVKNYVAAGQYLADAQAAGLTRTVSVTNFDTKRLEEFRDGGVTLTHNQVGYSLLDRRPENGMTDYCASTGLKIIPYGVIAGGLLSDRYLGLPASSVTVNTYSKSKYASIIQQNGGWEWFQKLLSALSVVAGKHNASIANVSARWVLDKPSVPAVLVGARNANHVQEVGAIFDFKLDGEDNARIDEVLNEGRQAQNDCYTFERGGVW